MKLYMIKFNKNNTIKLKVYFFDCAVKNETQQPIIIIIYDKCNFFINNNIEKA